MYATEGLGKFSVFGEKPLSVSMASTNFLRNPVVIRPPTWATSHTNHCNTRIISGRVPVPTMLTCRCSVDAKSVGGDVFSVTSSSKSDVDYLGQSTKGDLNLKLDRLEAFGIEGQETLEGPIEEVARVEAREAEGLLTDLGIPSPYSSRQSPRGIFCTRTLNLRSISAIGYDMDYTLMHYNVMAWEGRAYDYCMENLRNMGFPVDGLAFDPDLVIRGLVIDKERGNLVKADRFGYIKRAMHGTEMLSTRAVSEMYGRELVDLRKESQWEFLNTLFSVSEAVAYMQMVDRLDDGAIAAELGPLDYKGLYKAVGRALFRAHVEGQLKSEIMSKPELFVEPDPELPLALLDQKEAGKKLLLITNSDYHYTDKMMQHSFNRFLPNDMGWRELFDIVIVSARKPEFFQMSQPMYEVVTREGLMRPCFKARTGGLYSGGSAQMVENSLNIHGDEILYVGDHIYTDVSQSKVHLRWRTALICRELEEEYSALIGSRGHRASLVELINQKEIVGDLFNQLRLALQRRTKERPAQTLAATNMDDQELTESMQKLLIVMQRLDEKIAPMLEADGELFNKRWGFLSRAGLWDKSHLMRQIEKYADIYTSRVSNFLHYTPLRKLPHFLEKNDMSILKGLIESLGSIFSSPYESHPNPSSPNSSSTMEGVAGPSVSNERVAYKLKGFFDLAKEEIAKAVRAEEWGLVDDAIVHYKNAQRILIEASSTSAPSFISSSEQEKVKSYRQKISKWQGQVSERLQALGGTSTSKSTLAPAQTAAVTSTTLNRRKDVLQKSSRSSTNNPLMRNQTDKVVSPKNTQESNSGYEAKLVEMINTTIVDRSPSVKWDDVAGLEKAKQTLMEMVILPTKRRDLFTGLRRPARGLLLFGPPGNGKTMLAKAVASESEATFFNVSASSLTSKWVGEAEKLVRALFMVAKSRQPSVIFIDEIDSVMSTRLANENDASRRLKSEFLIQFDGVTSNPNDVIIVIGATNKPQELDDAVLRRLVKRIYIPLPDENVRRLLLKNKLKGQAFSLPSGDLERLARETEGYSGSDLQALCEEAAMMPIRELGANILTVKANQVRPLRYEDFRKSMSVIRPSLNKSKWEELEQWNQEYGSN